MPGGPDYNPGALSAALAICLCLLAACAGQYDQSPSAPAGDIPPRHLITGLPLHPQVEDQCGPASLATMLSVRGVQVDPESLRGKLYVPDKEGALTTEMVARARRFGLLVYPLEPELRPVLEEVAAGNPVLVMQNLALDWLPRWHFSVVIGFDRVREVVIIRSGDERAQEVPFDLFVKTWDRADRWAVVIVAPRDLPATAREHAFIRAANDLEQVGELDAALAAYLAAAVAWPDSDGARFGAGNVAYALGRYAQSVEWFAEFIAMRPTSAAGWNNMAYSLRQLDCDAAAYAAARCAVRLDPANDGLRESAASFEPARESGSDSACQVPGCPR